MVEDAQKDDLKLSPEDYQFIEALGLHFEDRGIPRIGGRIIGLLTLADKPLSLGRIAELLKVSPASVSTNIRQFHTKDLVQEISFPGDRRHYYVFSEAAWDHQFQAILETLATAAKIFRGGLSRLGPEDHPRRQRMSEAAEFFDFFQGVVASGLERWRTRSKEPRLAEDAPQTRSTS